MGAHINDGSLTSARVMTGAAMTVRGEGGGMKDEDDDEEEEEEEGCC